MKVGWWEQISSGRCAYDSKAMPSMQKDDALWTGILQGLCPYSTGRTGGDPRAEPQAKDAKVQPKARP